MVREQDVVENPIILKMEAYKTINRELTVKNQELRQYAGELREELTLLRRKLVEEREGQQEMKRSIVRAVTKGFNMILKVIFPENVENELSSSLSLQASTLKNKPSKPAVPEEISFYSPRTFTGSRTTRSPLAEVQRNCNVTQRNRQLEVEKTGMQESVSVQENHLKEHSEVENEIDVSRFSLPVIREEDIEMLQSKYVSSLMEISDSISEATIDMSNVCTRRRKRKESLHKNESMPQTPTVISSYEEDFSSRYVETEVPNSSIACPSNNNISGIQQGSMNETTFNNFSISKATSSTPYKTSQNMNVIRNVKVVIPRLTPEALISFGVSVDSKTVSNKTEDECVKENSKKLKRKNIGIGIKSENSEHPQSRPKRKAAQDANLVEPKLNVKLRRPNKH